MNRVTGAARRPHAGPGAGRAVALALAALVAGPLAPSLAGAQGRPLPSGQVHDVTTLPAPVHPTEGPAFAEVRVNLLLNVTDPQARNLVELAHRLRTRLGGEALLVYRLHGGRHGSTPLAMRALWAAHRQGRFFALLEEMMPGLQPFPSSEKEVDWRVRNVGLDLAPLQKDSFAPEVRQQLSEDWRFATRFGLDDAEQGLVINGQVVREVSSELVDEAVAVAQREARELVAGGLVPMSRVHARLLARHGRPDPELTVAPSRPPLGVLAPAASRSATAADSTLALLGPLPVATLAPSPRPRHHGAATWALRRHAPDISSAPRRGPARAKVDLVVFADFVGDDSVRLAGTTRRVLAEFGGRVQMHFMHYPGYLRRSVAFRAAEVAIAAHAQGCFWGFYDRLYAARQRRGKLVDLPGDFASGLEKLAQRSGCRAQKLTRELASGSPRRRLYADLAQAGSVPVWRSPAVLVNGRMLGSPDYKVLRNVVKDELKRR